MPFSTPAGLTPRWRWHGWPKRAARTPAYYLKIWLEDDWLSSAAVHGRKISDYVRELCRATSTFPLRSLPSNATITRQVVATAWPNSRPDAPRVPMCLCNRLIKFGAFVDRFGDAFDLSPVATTPGSTTPEPLSRLLKGVDPVKDQTYFLCQMDQDQIARSSFPSVA